MKSGTYSVFVASSEFAQAAEIQGKALGIEPVYVCTEHPIQDRSDAEMVEIADKAIDEILSKLVGPD